MEDDVNAQVDQVVSEITAGMMNEASTAPTTALPKPEVPEPQETVDEQAVEADVRGMKARLEAL